PPAAWAPPPTSPVPAKASRVLRNVGFRRAAYEHRPGWTGQSSIGPIGPAVIGGSNDFRKYPAHHWEPSLQTLVRQRLVYSSCVRADRGTDPNQRSSSAAMFRVRQALSNSSSISCG